MFDLLCALSLVISLADLEAPAILVFGVGAGLFGCLLYVCLFMRRLSNDRRGEQGGSAVEQENLNTLEGDNEEEKLNTLEGEKER